MRLNLAWLGLLLITSVFVYFTWYGYKILTTPLTIDKSDEGFANAQGIQITTCPAKSTMYINSAVLSICCNGQVESDFCSGEAICSLSESSKNIPTCSDWYAAYLREKGAGKCPASLPNYFETMDESKKGCTSGTLSRLGDSPADTNAPKCIIYPNKQENLAKKDSCLNTKYLQETSCFGSKTQVTTDKQMIETYFTLPTIVSCIYGNKQTLDFGTCYTDDSILRITKTVLEMFGNPISINEFKASSAGWDPMYKLNFCSVAGKYKLDKTIAFKDLEKVRVFE